MKVLVECLNVRLKLTLTDQHLLKSLADAVVEPFLRAYNKREVSVKFSSTAELVGVEVDGESVDPSRPAGELLSSAEPKVVLRAPPPESPAALVDALLALPATASADEAAAALYAVRAASREPAARQAVLSNPVRMQKIRQQVLDRVKGSKPKKERKDVVSRR